MGILNNKNFAWEIIILAWKITVYIYKTACMSDLHVSQNQGILKFYEKLYKEYGLVCGWVQYMCCMWHRQQFTCQCKQQFWL